MSSRKKRPAPPAPPETPADIDFGSYTASPEGKVWADGAVRWRVRGPGVSRLTRLLRREQAVDEVWAWLKLSGLAGARPAMWVERPAATTGLASPRRGR
jgi:hypothetical protein